LRDIRKRRGWSQQQLAERVTRLGHPMHRVTLAKIESGGERSESVRLDEVIALSYVLGVSPLHMIVPFDPDARLRVIATKPHVDAIAARQWLRGEEPLPDQERRFFLSEVPEDEVQAQLEKAR